MLIIVIILTVLNLVGFFIHYVIINNIYLMKCKQCNNQHNKYLIKHYICRKCVDELKDKAENLLPKAFRLSNNLHENSTHYQKNKN